jgi:hypothetical protein
MNLHTIEEIKIQDFIKGKSQDLRNPRLTKSSCSNSVGGLDVFTVTVQKLPHKKSIAVAPIFLYRTILL